MFYWCYAEYTAITSKVLWLTAMTSLDSGWRPTWMMLVPISQHIYMSDIRQHGHNGRPPISDSAWSFLVDQQLSIYNK